MPVPPWQPLAAAPRTTGSQRCCPATTGSAICCGVCVGGGSVREGAGVEAKAIMCGRAHVRVKRGKGGAGAAACPAPSPSSSPCCAHLASLAARCTSPLHLRTPSRAPPLNPKPRNSRPETLNRNRKTLGAEPTCLPYSCISHSPPPPHPHSSSPAATAGPRRRPARPHALGRPLHPAPEPRGAAAALAPRRATQGNTPPRLSTPFSCARGAE